MRYHLVTGAEAPHNPIETMTLYLMSTTVVPSGATGIWRMSALSTEVAGRIARCHADTLVSAVGHASTAEAMTELLGLKVEASRISVAPRPGDEFLCFKLLRRPDEGAILTRAQLDELGYEFCLMEYETEEDRKSTRLNSSHVSESRMPSSA